MPTPTDDRHPRLALLREGRVAQVFPLRPPPRLGPAARGQWTIGRRVGHAVPILEDPTVSRDHAVIVATESGFVLRDLPGCLNRSAVNGVALRPGEARVLRSGDLLEAGRTRLRFDAGAFPPA